METPQPHRQWQGETSLSSLLGKDSLEFASLNSEFPETNCANVWSCSQQLQISWSRNPALVFFVLALLVYLLITDSGQSTKPLQPNVSFRGNFGRTGLISFGIGLLGATEAKFSSFFLYHFIRWRRQTQWNSFLKKLNFKCKKKDYMMCTASFPPSWSSPTFLTGLWTWPLSDSSAWDMQITVT